MGKLKDIEKIIAPYLYQYPAYPTMPTSLKQFMGTSDEMMAAMTAIIQGKASPSQFPWFQRYAQQYEQQAKAEDEELMKRAISRGVTGGALANVLTSAKQGRDAFLATNIMNQYLQAPQQLSGWAGERKWGYGQDLAKHEDEWRKLDRTTQLQLEKMKYWAMGKMQQANQTMQGIGMAAAGISSGISGAMGGGGMGGGGGGGGVQPTNIPNMSSYYSDLYRQFNVPYGSGFMGQETGGGTPGGGYYAWQQFNSKPDASWQNMFSQIQNRGY